VTPAFIDTNVPMYAAGAPHPYRGPAVEVLAAAAERPQAFVTSAEVLQEILHRRIAARGRWTIGARVLQAFHDLMRERIEPILDADVMLASGLAADAPGADARDLLHAAVMRRLGVTLVISTDRGFDAIEGITRLELERIEEWLPALE
jgi:predicted nucleic acid-binding protein